MPSISINTSKKYKIYFECNIFDNVADILNSKSTHSKIIIVFDSKLSEYALKLQQSLSRFYQVDCIPFDVLEKNKNLSNAFNLVEKILSLNIDKKSSLIALGGGVIGDIVGFCASIILRGIDYYQIPTTLLAMVDSSIGGKCGVNTLIGKNLIGSIYSPKAVFIDLSLLHSLPYRELASGYTECVKYALLFSKHYFYFLDNNIDKLLNKDVSYLSTIIKKSCKYKKYIVQKDEYETKNIRILLNLGHSFAHTLEKYNNYSNTLLHGEAVAIGCILAFKFAHFYKIANIDFSNILTNHFTKTNLLVNIKNILPNINAPKLLEFMLQDKKNSYGKINLVLPKTLGKSILVKNIDTDLLLNFLQKELLKC